jgi:hypothetical protein
MLQTRVLGKIKTHFDLDTLFYENRAVYEKMYSHCRAAQATDENMAHAHWMLDT